MSDFSLLTFNNMLLSDCTKFLFSLMLFNPVHSAYVGTKILWVDSCWYFLVKYSWNKYPDKPAPVQVPHTPQGIPALPWSASSFSDFSVPCVVYHYFCSLFLCLRSVFCPFLNLFFCFSRGATNLSEGLRLALQWVCWNQMESTVSSTGQLQTLFTETIQMCLSERRTL